MRQRASSESHVSIFTPPWVALQTSRGSLHNVNTPKMLTVNISHSSSDKGMLEWQNASCESYMQCCWVCGCTSDWVFLCLHPCCWFLSLLSLFSLLKMCFRTFLVHKMSWVLECIYFLTSTCQLFSQALPPSIFTQKISLVWCDISCMCLWRCACLCPHPPPLNALTVLQCHLGQQQLWPQLETLQTY